MICTHIREAHIARAFSIPPEYNKSCYDIVINLAAETRQGQPEALYTTRCSHLAKICAEKAAATGVSRFIQVRSGAVRVMMTVMMIVCDDSAEDNSNNDDDNKPCLYRTYSICSYGTSYPVCILCWCCCQVSTAQVYQCSSSSSPNAKPATEKSPIEPWTAEARSTYQGVRCCTLKHKSIQWNTHHPLSVHKLIKFIVFTLEESSSQQKCLYSYVL